MKLLPLSLLMLLCVSACARDAQPLDPTRDTDLPFAADTGPVCFPEELLCDGVDDDCDGEVDEGLVVDFYRDEDGDGVGGEQVEARCPSGTAGWTQRTGDCDDTDRTLSPDAVELCNERDDDCDGEVDEGLEAPTWYLDGDDDGYGLAETSVQACFQPEGYSSRDGDCDDSTASVRPGAVEACGNLVDDDCDGAVDEVSQCCVSTTSGSDRYLLCTDRVPWTEARDACAADGWILAVANDAAENAWMGGIVEWHRDDVWLGLTDVATEGTWLTAGDTAPSWYGWRSGEPNNSTGVNPDGQDCVAYVYTSAAWHDVECERSLAFLCEPSG